MMTLVLGWPTVSTASQGQSGAFEGDTSFVAGRILIKFRSDVLEAAGRGLIAASGAREASEIPQIGVHVLELPKGADETVYLHAFQSRPEVEFAELDRILKPTERLPNDPSYPGQWHLTKIGGPAAWSTTTGSPNVIIAILDSGIDATHPDLASKVVPGWNVYDNNSDTSDVYGHGTAVAGSAAAATDNTLGVAAVAWGAMIMPVRVSNASGYTSTSTIASGLTWAADHGARVANISYQVSNNSTVGRAARYFSRSGGVVVVSSGNDSMFDSAADDPNVITVSASYIDDTIVSWSNTGNNIDLAAPGVSITTTNRGGGYAAWSGTSFSAPIVAGVAALVISANPGLTATQVQDILKQSADDLGDAGWDSSYGWGRVNAAAAVALANGNPPASSDTTPPTVNITSPGDGTTIQGTSVSVLVNAVDDAAVVKVELYVDGVLKATSTKAPFTTNWSTRKVSSGAHSLQCRAYDAAGNQGISSLVTVYK